MTLLQVLSQPARKAFPSRDWTTIGGWIVIGILVVLLMGAMVFLGRTGLDSMVAGAGTGIVSVVYWGAMVFLAMLAVLWMIFPLMVWRLLKRILGELEKLVENTKR